MCKKIFLSRRLLYMKNVRIDFTILKNFSGKKRLFCRLMVQTKLGFRFVYLQTHTTNRIGPEIQLSFRKNKRNLSPNRNNFRQLQFRIGKEVGFRVKMKNMITEFDIISNASIVIEQVIGNHLILHLI